jgi:NADH:ubiquinone oxidoreductase subunit 5 (subunit L)/multisubunit Na+/H+ antiporter MnhA subunit
MYLDPGFGSMLIQALIGLIAVAGSSLYLFRQKIKAFFSKPKKNEDNHEQTNEQNNEQTDQERPVVVSGSFGDGL